MSYTDVDTPTYRGPIHAVLLGARVLQWLVIVAAARRVASKAGAAMGASAHSITKNTSQQDPQWPLQWQQQHLYQMARHTRDHSLAKPFTSSLAEHWLRREETIG